MKIKRVLLFLSNPFCVYSHSILPLIESTHHLVDPMMNKRPPYPQVLLKSLNLFKLFLSESLFLVSLCLCSQVSFAQEAEEEKVERVQQLVVQARAAAAKGEYRESIRLFEEANDLFSSADNIFAIASVYERIEGACAEAVNAWDRFLSACQECSLKSRGEERAQRLKEQCTIQLTVDTKPVGAEITLDGEPQGKTPRTFTAFAGRHKLALSLEGYHPEQKSLFLLKGSKTELISTQLTLLTSKQGLSAATSPSTTSPSTLTTPLSSPSASGTLQALAPPEDLPQASSGNALTYGLIGAGVLMTGLGVWSYLSARSEVSEINQAESVDELNQANANSSYQLKEGLGYVGMGVGLGLSAYGIVRLTF